MRLTRETLLKVARDSAAERARVSRRIICIYLTGSVLTKNPLLGGTTDIDLVIIHDSDPVQPREMVRLSDEVHLDISHYSQSVFHHPRHLRTDPWLGPFIYSKPLVLHDTQHWFDFAQAATGAQFHQPDYVLQRAIRLAQSARQGWMDMSFNRSAQHPRRVYDYFKAMENAGNALSSLTGEPLTERRFMLLLPQRTQALRQPDLAVALINLAFTNPQTLETVWAGWLEGWAKTYQAAGLQENNIPRLQPFRQMYYQRAAEALWSENSAAAAWLLLRTWTLAASHLPVESEPVQNWQEAVRFLQFDEEHFSARLDALDHYLDRVEETLETWGRINGASSQAEDAS